MSSSRDERASAFSGAFRSFPSRNIFRQRKKSRAFLVAGEKFDKLRRMGIYQGLKREKRARRPLPIELWAELLSVFPPGNFLDKATKVTFMGISV